jgi:phage terminase large subunit
MYFKGNEENDLQTKIMFEPQPKQKEFMDQVFRSDLMFIAYGGAAGGGKTFSSLATLILFCRLYPNSRWCVIRKSLTEIKLNTLPSFFKVCPNNFVANYNKSEQIIYFKNKSSILFKGENIDSDPELQWMDGLEVNGFLLEQAEELSYKTFDKCKLRAGRHVIEPRPPIKILLTLNPAQSWTKSIIYIPYKEDKLKPPYAYIPARMSDNISLPKEYVENMQYLDEHTRRRFVDGDWDAVQRTGAECYHSFNYGIHVKPVTFNPDLNVHLSFDFNTVPYMTLICCQISLEDGRWKVRFYKEYCLKNPFNSTKSVCQAFAKDHESFNNRVFYYGDYSGKSSRVDDDIHRYDTVESILRKWLTNNSDRVQPNPSVIRRIRFLNAIFEGKLNIDIEIDPSLERLIEDLSYVLQAPDGGKHKKRVKDSDTGVTYEPRGHTSDAKEYLLCSAFSEAFERFK